MTKGLARLRASRKLVVVYAWICVAGTTSAFAQDGPFTVLTDEIETGIAAYSEGIWEISLVADGLVFRNDHEDQAGAKAYFIQSDSVDDHRGRRTITALVEVVDGTQYSHIGIVYWIDSSNHYFFELDNVGDVEIYAWQEGEPRLRMANYDPVEPYFGPAELQIEERGDQLTFRINGEVAAILGGLEGFGRATVGLMAWGTGVVAARAFSVETADP